MKDVLWLLKDLLETLIYLCHELILSLMDLFKSPKEDKEEND